MINIHTDEALFNGFRQLIADCGPTVNKHDLVYVLISACIDRGFATRPRIVGALDALGFDRRHVAILLKKATGSNPERDRWQRDQQGQYTLHEETGA